MSVHAGIDIKLTLIFVLQDWEQSGRTRIPSDAECHDLKRGFSVLDDNSPGMRDVKAYYDGQWMARAAAVEKDIAREPVDDWRSFIRL